MLVARAALLLTLAVAVPAVAAVEATVEALLFPNLDVEALRARGPAVLPEMARLYEASDVPGRRQIASAFYSLGWKSPEAKRVLMADVHTSDRELRLNVQWALGRVSADTDVVDVLLDNMQHDDNPLFRDKAACALAHDQIHLTEEQKVYLYERLVRAMRDPKPDVRAIAAKVLEIQTGQTKGFDPNAPQGEREASIRTWQRWLDEYRASL
jgi:HEAT repeat protein